jgi:prepilin-type N-terminal cleavage/methylation domain-containing protein
MSNQYSKSFTLIELLIVLALIAILATVLILTIKPGAIFSKARDTKRINDLKNIEKIMDVLYATDQTFYELNYASSNVVYISLPDSSSTCGSWLSQLPSLPSGWSYRCSANPTNIDGTGWIPIPFSNFPTLNISQLFIDPINKPPYYYSFVVGGSYAVYGQLEDPKNPASKNDNDNYPHLFSAGTNKRLIDQAQGLVGYWSFDEGSGTIAKDYSGNGNNGTLVNGPTWTTGKVGGALSFDGVNDYVNVPYNSVLDIVKNFTIEVWIYPKEQTFNHQTAVEKWQTYLLMHLHAGATTFQHYIFAGGAWHYVRASQPWSYYIGKWGHYVFTYDGTTLKSYVNGVLDNQTTYIGQLTSNTNPVTIGKGAETAASFFNGLIDEVRIYNRALSDAEIQALYNATK